MMRQGVAEALCNLALSVALTLWLRSMVGVALGSVIPTVLFGWGLLWGWAAHEAGLSRWRLFCTVVGPAWTGCLPMLAVAACLRMQPWWASGSNTVLVLGEGAVVGLAGVAGLWWIALTAADRERFSQRLATRFKRRVPVVNA